MQAETWEQAGRDKLRAEAYESRPIWKKRTE
jgi:hypothetical protein